MHYIMFHTWTCQKYILYCTQTLPLYFMSKRAIRYMLSFTHTVRLYYIRRTLLNSKKIWWYQRRAVCTWIWDRAIFCAILHTSARSLRIAYRKDPSITSSTITIITIYTLISALLWTSIGPFPWWRCIPFAKECLP